MKKLLLKLWWCKIMNFHKWTSPVEEGKLEPIDLNKATARDIKMALYRSSKMTCVRCEAEAEPSKRMLRSILSETIISETYE